jgi:hypothetical protein
MCIIIKESDFMGTGSEDLVYQQFYLILDIKKKEA